MKEIRKPRATRVDYQEMQARLSEKLNEEGYALRQDIKELGDDLFWRGAACLTFFSLWMFVVMLLT